MLAGNPAVSTVNPSTAELGGTVRALYETPDGRPFTSRRETARPRSPVSTPAGGSRPKFSDADRDKIAFCNWVRLTAAIRR